MESLEKLEKWEEMSVSGLISTLTLWFGCDEFEFTAESRPAVATRIWFTLKFNLPNGRGCYVDGSSLLILKRRLIEGLDRNQVSKSRLAKKYGETN